MLDNFDTIVDKFDFPQKDNEWILLIYQYLIRFYEEHKNMETFQGMSENDITTKIYSWLKRIRIFTSIVTVNSQPRTDKMDIEGYYDLKFESCLWNEGQSHFAIENKLLENTETSIKNYLYYPDKSKGVDKGVFDDGGLYRFLSNKYADKQPYGGMIAFIKRKNISDIMTNLRSRIKNLTITENEKYYGQITDEAYFDLKILNFENSFQSYHIRKDGTDIQIFHLFFNFN